MAKAIYSFDGNRLSTVASVLYRVRISTRNVALPEGSGMTPCPPADLTALRPLIRGAASGWWAKMGGLPYTGPLAAFASAVAESIHRSRFLATHFSSRQG